jgi:hypothetical protein
LKALRLFLVMCDHDEVHWNPCGLWGLFLGSPLENGEAEITRVAKRAMCETLNSPPTAQRRASVWAALSLLRAYRLRSFGRADSIYPTANGRVWKTASGWLPASSDGKTVGGITRLPVGVAPRSA